MDLKSKTPAQRKGKIHRVAEKKGTPKRVQDLAHKPGGHPHRRRGG